MPTYYFDPVTGSDLNNGLAASAPLQGISPPITDYMVTGNTLRFKRGAFFTSITHFTGRLLATDVSGLVMEDYGDGANPPQFEVRTSVPSENWVYTGSGKIWYRQRSFIRQVQGVFVGDRDVELLESSYKNGGVAGIDGSQTFWYWALNDPVPGSDRLYMWSGSSTLNPAQVWGSVKIADLSTAAASGSMILTRCSDVILRNLCITGPISDHIRIRGGNNFLLDGVVLGAAPQRGGSLVVEVSGPANADHVEIIDCQFLSTGKYRNWYTSSEAVNTDPNVDPSNFAPARLNDPGDVIKLLCAGNVSIRNSLIEAGYHSALNAYFPNASLSGNINLEITNSKIVCGTLGPYSRAFSLQRRANGGPGNIVLNGNKISGQSTRTQIAGCVSARISNNIFGPCRASPKSLPDYYNENAVHDVNYDQHLMIASYGSFNRYDGGADSIVIENNEFQASRVHPISALFLTGEPSSDVCVIRNNHFSNNADPWRSVTPAPRLVQRDRAGSWVPQFLNNTYEGNYNPVVGLSNGSSYDDMPINDYGGGNVEQSKKPGRPIIGSRLQSTLRA